MLSLLTICIILTLIRFTDGEISSTYDEEDIVVIKLGLFRWRV